MRHWLVLAALGAAFLTMPAWGQRRGGGSMGFAGHAGFASHGSPMVSGRGPVMIGHGPGFASAQHWAITYGRPVAANGPIITNGPYYYHHFGYYGRRRYAYYPWWAYGGWYGYPWGYWDSDYSSQQQAYPAYDASAYYAQSAMQAQQASIDRLEDEVARLREERERAAQQQSSSAQSHPKAEPQPTELIFRDKHTEQVQNYAIVGQTFWIFSEQRARKIALADLDLPATQKANEDRGVDFELPR